jgi:3-oxoadipate enol-lactonase
MGVEARTGWLDVPHGRIYYEVAGRGSPLVLVHAAIADRRQWDREFELYSKDHTVVRYDGRGLGKSPPTEGPFATHDDLERLLEHLRLGAVTLVGCSMGGRTAIDLALDHPASVRALLLLAPGLSGWDPQMDPEGDAVYAGDGARSMEIVEAWNAGRRDEAIERMRVYWCSATTGPALELVRAMIRDNADEIFTDRTGGQSRALDPPAAGRLGSIKVPTVVLYGDQDEPTMEFIVKRVARGIPNARLVRPGHADHLVNLSRPDIFDAQLIDLLR